jgi:pyridinium-3,5-bisthiocarboxylic acid mononucleotide nickel chelatase
MRIAYLDCASGISGDMTLGALVDAGADLANIQAGIDSLGLPSCRLVATEVKKRGFRATQITVEHEPEHKHRHLHHITAMIDGSTLNDLQKAIAKRIFQRLAEAEAKVHASTIEKVHFHEVGAVDSIADIVGAAIGFDLLGIERVYCSPVPTGHGFIEIAHGRCSIPAPATAELLRDVPLSALDVEGELTTPTGAAIVAAMADGFGPLPAMNIWKIGYGAGQKDFPQANLLRLFFGESEPKPVADGQSSLETIVVLETNVDNATGEVIGHAVDRLWSTGALDVSLTAIQMKKNRPGVLISVQCYPGKAAALQDVLFAELPTLGVRQSTMTRTALARLTHTLQTAYGDVQGKFIINPDGTTRFAPEFDSCSQIAEERGVPLADVMAAAQVAFSERQRSHL